jgi:renalase
MAENRDEPDTRARASAAWMAEEPLDASRTVRDLEGLEVAVVGAGLAGLASAGVLALRGARVTVFDKGQVPGGRLSQRSDRGHRFDHGAQYFTARGRALAAQVDRWSEAGVVARWSPRVGGDGGPSQHAKLARDPMLVATPGMNAMALALAAACDVRRGVRIARVVARDGRLAIEDDEGTERARVDRVVIAVPAPQAAGLLGEAPALAIRARAGTMSPCWALMLAFERPLAAPFDVARFESGAIAWAARDSAKPGRDGSNGETWVAHAATAWSLAHLEDDVPTATSALVAAFHERVDGGAAEPRMAHAHRWRFARTEVALGESCMVDGAGRIAVCGDWCLGARVEHAYVSGLAAGRAIARA